MANLLIGIALVLMICVGAARLSARSGMPVLLLFLGVGVLFGSDGLLGIYFTNYTLSETICSVGLIFIMFYGGFGTNTQVARPVVLPAVLLSTAGVFLTALLTGLFCALALRLPWLESFLIGAVISSTDFASVYSLLKTQGLNLKDNLASLLEIESGSNDPFSYLMTVVLIGMMQARAEGSVVQVLFTQVGLGVLCGVLVGFLAVFLYKWIGFESGGLQTIYVVAVALLAYSLPQLAGGNGYLSAYLCGIVMSRQKFAHKLELVHFFDGLTWLMQIAIFFVLGLLSTPSMMPPVLLKATSIALFVSLLARPLVVFLILSGLGFNRAQMLLVSAAGLRGAASLVFAILAVTAQVPLEMDIFHTVFTVAVLSVGAQGTLLPWLARRLDLVDENESVYKTFSDYQEPADFTVLPLLIEEKHPWENRRLRQIELPKGSLIILIRRGTDNMVPNGDTWIQAGDELILSTERLQ